MFFTNKIIFCLLISALTLPTLAFAGGVKPEDTIKNMQNAISRSDDKLFEQQIKIDSIVNSAIDFFMKEAQNPEGRAALPPALGLMFSSLGDSKEAKASVGALLTSEAKSFVLYGVKSGAFAGKMQQGAAKPSGMLAPFFANASLGRKDISILGPAITLDKSRVTMPINVYDDDSKQNYAVTVLMQNGANGWIIENITNIKELYQKIKREAEQNSSYQ